jgi:hypothetical protein
MTTRRWTRKPDLLAAAAVWVTWVIITAAVLLALCILVTLAA